MKIEHWRKLKIGDMVACMITTSAMKKGERGVVYDFQGMSPTGAFSTSNTIGIRIKDRTCSVPIHTLEIGNLTRGIINEDICRLEEEINSAKTMLQKMDDLGMETYDENIIKVYEALSIIEKKGTTKALKAKLIAELINK